MLLECFSKNYSGNKKKKEYSGGKILSCIQNKKRQKKKHFHPLLQWFGWGSSWISECVLAGKHHTLKVMGAPCLQVLCVEGWCNTSDHHGYHRWVLACSVFFFSPPPHNACSCVRCVAMQTSPAATVKISMEEVWTPSRLKGEEGDRKQAEREEGRSVDRQETCSFICSSLSFWCIN